METKIRIFAILASILMLTVIAMPMVGAIRQDTRRDRVEILPIEERIPEVVEIDLEIIKNTRELTIVKINDILITQKLDSYSTKENATAVLTIEDLNSDEVVEMEIKTSYKAGEYTTTLYSEGKLLNVFMTRFDPLEPGALREIDEISGDSMTPFSLQSSSVSRFWWDGVRYICGTNRDMPFARPCHITYNVCKFQDVLIRGTRMQHLQLSRSTSQGILSLPPIVIGALLGAKIGTILFPGKGTAWGAAIGAVIGHLASHILIRRNLECDRGNIWMVVHRELKLSLIPIPPHALLMPRFIRLGRLNIWDTCPHIVPIPAWRDS